MSQVAEPNKTEVKTVPPGRQFRANCTAIATSLLTDWVGQDRASEAIGRVAVALSAAASASKKPEDFYDCTPESVGAVIAISALSGIMVGNTRNSLAYAIPRRQRKGERPQLRYELSHRGVAALVKRSGQFILPIPISNTDDIESDESGEIVIKHRDIDNPPQTFEDLRGIVLLVKDLASGSVLFRGWVPKTTLEKRRNKSEGYKFALANEWARDSDPWHQWPIEQSMKTAMHYAVSRGWCVIDDTSSIRALSVDSENTYGGGQVIDAEPVKKKITTLDNLTDRLTQKPANEEPEQEETEQPAEVEAPKKETKKAAKTETKTEPKTETKLTGFFGLMERIVNVENEADHSRLCDLVDADWTSFSTAEQGALKESLKQSAIKLGIEG